LSGIHGGEVQIARYLLATPALQHCLKDLLVGPK